MLADSGKHRGNVSSIRRAHPRAAPSSEAVRVGPRKGRAREAFNISASLRIRSHVRPIEPIPTPSIRRKRLGWFRVSDTGGQLAAALAVGAALVGSVLRFNAMQLLGAVGVGSAAGVGIVTGLVGTAVV